MAMVKRHHENHGTLVFAAIDEIQPNPAQPRKRFDERGIRELSDSIARYGVLQPLSVRLRNGGYELVAGERRLRAARLAGLSEVPCIVMEIGIQESSIIALVENLQRRDLDFVEEAQGIAQLIRVFRLSQEQVAERLGKSQSSVANKLRLLKLPEDVLEGLRAAGLSERHARALLKLPSEQEQRAMAEYAVANGLTVAATEAYIEKLLKEQKEKERQKKPVLIIKDVRLFLNTISHGLDVMKQSGVDVRCVQTDTESEIILTINIPKKSAVKSTGNKNT